MAYSISPLACGFVCVYVMVEKMESLMSDSCVHSIHLS